MKYRIAMIFKGHIVKYFSENPITVPDNVEISFFTYDSMEEIGEIYNKIKQEFDGIITSGVLPHSYLQGIKKKESMCLEYFKFYEKNTYRLILKAIADNKCHDITRVGIDFLPSSMNFAQIIEHDLFSKLLSEFVDRINSTEYNLLSELEKTYIRKLENLFEMKKIDFAVTHFYTIAEKMTSLGYECCYIYPSNEDIYNLIQSLLNKIDKLRFRKSFPVIIKISVFDKSQNIPDSELKMAKYKKEILSIIEKYNNSLTLKDLHNGFEIYTDCETLEEMTDSFTHCLFLKQLKETLFFNGCIGYGIGRSVYQARTNAYNAIKYSNDFAKYKEKSYLIDEDNRIYNMELQKEKQICFTNTQSDYIYKLAKQVKLSPETVNKILLVIKKEGTNNISSLELMNRLNISLRTANRYLANFMKYGKARIIGQKRIIPKGRPHNIYELDTKTN